MWKENFMRLPYIYHHMIYHRWLRSACDETVCGALTEIRCCVYFAAWLLASLFGSNLRANLQLTLFFLKTKINKSAQVM